jgi:hypothetical protein
MMISMQISNDIQKVCTLVGPKIFKLLADPSMCCFVSHVPRQKVSGTKRGRH